jgi:hypothetical protein
MSQSVSPVKIELQGDAPRPLFFLDFAGEGFFFKSVQA